MELSLKQEQTKCYESVVDTVITQEETMEMIVPDACPDVLQIVDTEGFACIRSKEAKDGLAQIDGTVKTTVFYTPEGAGGLRQLQMQIPFFTKVENTAINPRTTLHVYPSVQSAETRMINPRKILVRVQICLRVCAYGANALETCSDVEADEGAKLQTLTAQHDIWVITGVAEKAFQFADSLPVSAGKAAVDEVLKYRATVETDEAKVIGTKLIFKGAVALRVLYRSDGGALQTMDYTLPFSQMLEMPGVEETASCNLDVQITDASVALEEETDGAGAFAVSLGFLAQAQAWEEKAITMVSDLYSTAHTAAAQVQNYIFHVGREQARSRLAQRASMETSVLPKQALDAYATVNQLNQVQEGEERLLTAEALIRVLYLGEDNEVYQSQIRLPVEERIAMHPEAVCFYTAACPGEIFASPVAGGLEARFDVELRHATLEKKRVAGITNVNIEEATASEEERPSVVLRMAEPGDRLWDLAKQYCSTVDDICAANEMQEADICEGKLLLIPKKR